MRTRHALTILAAAVLASVAVALLVPALAQEQTASVANARAEADAAFDAGEHGRALELYDRALVTVPDDVHALVRSGMLLSWTKRYDEAIARYDRALTIEPNNAVAALERAKVLSWAARYDEAADAFRAILTNQPRDREARLGLARSLSWGGKQTEARAEYEAVLANHPGDVEAMVGIAQTHAWSGNATEARDAYGEALSARPSGKEANLGLAYLDLEQGDLRAAERRTHELEQANPGDSEVADLSAAVKRAKAPWIEVGTDRVDDTDDTTIETWRLEGGLGLPAGLDLRLALAFWDITTGPLEGSIDSLAAVLGWTPKARHRLEARVGVDQLEDSGGVSTNEMTGGLAYTFPLASRWSGRVAWDRDPYRYSVPILDNGIVGDMFTARSWGTFGKSWRFNGGLGRWDLNDDNSRSAADASVLYAWRVRKHTLEAGYAFRWLDWSEDLDNGYFDPSDFMAHIAVGRASGPIRTKGYYDATLEAGVQSFTESGREVSGDPFVSAYAVAGAIFREALRLEGYAGYSSFAQQGGEDYRSRRLGVRLRYSFGVME